MTPCPCWLLLVAAVMACACVVPGFGSECLDGAVCHDLSDKGRILDCIRLCMSAIQSEFPELSALALKVNQDDADSADELLLSILLAVLASEERAPGSDPRAPQSHRQRSYSMEHFRWGKPQGLKTQEPKAGVGPQKDRRRSYSMEHFRWGKPPGRKRRPVKILASRLEGAGSREARRQVAGEDERARGEQNQARGSPAKAQKERKDNYRMSHFRWGSPAASKRNGNLVKAWEEKRQLTKILRNIIIKDMRRIMG